MESLNQIFQSYLPALEAELQRLVNRVKGPELDLYHLMLAYHMGWEGPGAGPEARGKRIRPLLVLLVIRSGFWWVRP